MASKVLGLEEVSKVSSMVSWTVLLVFCLAKAMPRTTSAKMVFLTLLVRYPR